MIVPTAVEAAHPGPPDGYRVRRRLVDDTDMTVRMIKPDVALAEWNIEIAGMHAPTAA